MARSIQSLSRRSLPQTARSLRRAADRAVHSGLGIETLELRTLMAGDVAGTLYDDVNNNGVKDNGENGLQGWTIFVDSNTDGRLDTGEASAVTNVDGDYLLTGITSGTRNIRAVMQPGWVPSSGTSDNQNITVKNDTEVKADFFMFRSHVGSIEGVVYNDLNADGIRDVDPTTGGYSEPGLEGWTVYLDNNNNRTPDAGEPTAITDAAGAYTFINLQPGDYEVTEVIPPGWNASPTSDPRQTVAVNDGVVSTAADFANFSNSNGSISGVVWNDLNADGIRAATDPALAGWTIYLDLNANSAKDAGEPSAVTNSAGAYSFAGLQVGDYDVVEILPAGWETSAAYDSNYTVAVFGGTNSVAPDFANHSISSVIPGSISGTVWNDVNGNGVRDVDAGGAFTDPGLSGWTVYADLNSNNNPDLGEPEATTTADGSYTISNLTPGTIRLVELPVAGWRNSAPATNIRTVTIKNGQDLTGQDFGNARLMDSSIRGNVYFDADRSGARATSERGLAGITIYLDTNNNGSLDAGEPKTTTSEDLYFTPTVNEAGDYSFSHLAGGTYTVRTVVPDTLSATPAAQLTHTVTITSAEDRTGIDTAAVFRPNEIHGVQFDDANGNHQKDAGESGLSGATVFVDLNRNDTLDAGEPKTVTGTGGSYTFTGLTPGAYVVRTVAGTGSTTTYPQTTGGILWPTGTSNPAVGNVGPTSITTTLTAGQSYRGTVSITLPNSGALTNLVDVFLLFDDTGSFTNNSPIVRAAFPEIMTQLQASLPGIDLGFGVGRFEEYANFAYEYDTGRPFVLNQPIVAASTPGYQSAIQSALNRETPGYGGDQPETDIEALYQLVTGKGFDGNNNGSVLDSGAAGLASTQLTPGGSGDVPSFASFTADAANGVLPAAGTVGGGGFRAGALPIILTATDTGFAYQPKGETTVTGVGGVTLPVSALSETSRLTTPFNYGAGLQETVTGLNALGALVIGLGTNPESTLDPRQGLESLSKLTGAVNRSAATIANGTADPIAPGDPLYFQIASGFSTSVASGVVNAIQNAVTNVAVDVTVQASDPRVKIINHTGTRTSVGAGQTATFDVEIVGDGAPRRFDLQFVRAGTNVVLGSIPVVIGTPVPGNGYEFCEVEDGEIADSIDFGATTSVTPPPVNVAPSFTKGADQRLLEDAVAQTVSGWATGISAGPASEAGQKLTFSVSNDNNALFSVQPTLSADGTLTFTPAANANGTATVTVTVQDDGGTANGGVDTSTPQTFKILITPVNDAPSAGNDSYTTAEDTQLTVALPGVLGNDSDIENDLLSASLVSGPAHGSVSLNADGSFTYTPASNYNGPDSFTYVANDGSADSNVATVSINVTAVNDAPTATNDSYTTAEDTQLAVALPGLLANDSDGENDPLTALLIAGPAHGALTLNGDGSFTYTPDANYNGTDSFTYKVNDGSADSNVATVNLTVTPVNDPPTATNDSYSTSEDSTLTVPAAGVLANDADVDGDSLTVRLLSGPSHGTLALNPDGSFSYTPAANYNGTDSFTYVASDGSADSNAATVTLTVSAVNDAPVAVNDSYSTPQDAALTISAPGVLANDSDIDGDTLAATIVNGPSHGSLVMTSNGAFVYTPAAGYSGADSFSYTATDGSAQSNVATVTIQVTPVVLPGGTKFYVADATADATFGYDAAGLPTTRGTLNKENKQPRGIAANKQGTTLWTVDQKGDVFVYSSTGKLLGTWTADGLGKPEGITTDGTNLWIVDDDSNKVFYFAGAASRLSGEISATSSFSLNKSNANAMDVVTDGSHLWVVNDTSKTDSVFRYSMAGTLEGSWQIDATNKTPTGLTIDPNHVSDVWIVDGKTGRVYQYDGATARVSGSQSASGSFALSGGNKNPQGIADPKPSRSTYAAALSQPAADVRGRRHGGHKAATTAVRQATPWWAGVSATTATRPETHSSTIDDLLKEKHDGHSATDLD